MTTDGELIKQCHEHLIEFMQQNVTPIQTAVLVEALNREADKRGITFGGDAIARREAYRMAILAERQKKTILTGKNWDLIWYEHVPENERETW